MKRDWKLIRAILLEYSTDTWTDDSVNQHIAFCADRGWVRATVYRGLCAGYVALRNDQDFITSGGLDIADALRHIGDLAWALSELDARGIGHSEELVLSLVKKRAMERLSLQA